jgi:hypothetical protein
MMEAILVLPAAKRWGGGPPARRWRGLPASLRPATMLRMVPLPTRFARGEDEKRNLN